MFCLSLLLTICLLVVALPVSVVGVARMSDPKMIAEIKAAVTIPVMAKARIGHFIEAQVSTTTQHTTRHHLSCRFLSRVNFDKAVALHSWMRTSSVPSHVLSLYMCMCVCCMYVRSWKHSKSITSMNPKC